MKFYCAKRQPENTQASSVTGSNNEPYCFCSVLLWQKMSNQLWTKGKYGDQKHHLWRKLHKLQSLVMNNSRVVGQDGNGFYLPPGIANLAGGIGLVSVPRRSRRAYDFLSCY